MHSSAVRCWESQPSTPGMLYKCRRLECMPHCVRVNAPHRSRLSLHIVAACCAVLRSAASWCCLCHHLLHPDYTPRRAVCCGVLQYCTLVCLCCSSTSCCAHVQVDAHLHPQDVQATGRHISCQQEGHLSLPEALQGLQAGGLGHVTVQLGCSRNIVEKNLFITPLP